MRREVYHMAFELPARYDGTADSFVKRFYKWVKKRWGLTSVVEWKVREQERERCYRLLCPQCASGSKVRRYEGAGGIGAWHHGLNGCRAEELRESIYQQEQEQRRATDTKSMDESAPVPPVPRAAVGPGGNP